MKFFVIKFRLTRSNLPDFFSDGHGEELVQHCFSFQRFSVG